MALDMMRLPHTVALRLGRYILTIVRMSLPLSLTFAGKTTPISANTPGSTFG